LGLPERPAQTPVRIRLTRPTIGKSALNRRFAKRGRSMVADVLVENARYVAGLFGGIPSFGSKLIGRTRLIRLTP
jgi:hypothetical protein